MSEDQLKPDEVVCLACNQRFPAKSMTRGLCPADYQKFVRVKSKATAAEVPRLEAMLIADGKLLPDGRDADNPFAIALAKVRETEETYVPNEMAKFVDEKVSKRRATKSATERKTKGAKDA